MSRGHGDKAMSRREVKQDNPNPRKEVKNEMRCLHPDMKADKCHIQERHTTDTTIIMVPFSPSFLASTPVIFINKLDGDSICLCLCCSLHVQVSIHGDHGDRDWLEQTNKSGDSSTNISVGIQVGSHHSPLICN